MIIQVLLTINNEIKLTVTIALDIIAQYGMYCDISTKQLVFKSELTKNKLMRESINITIQNIVQLKYVLND